MLLIEEKQVPINIELVPMRSYGDKPAEFMKMVRGGLLPALTVELEDGRKQTITESQVIMELLDKWHTTSDGYKPMLPEENDKAGWAKYDSLARLERDLFSWWCTLIFRPEGPSMPSGLMGLLGGNKRSISGSMQGFLDCLSKVEKELASTNGPWFFDYDYPTMIDFVYASHVERMLASCAYWKGLNLRSEEMRSKYPSLNLWLDSFDKRECYLAFKSDYYTHVKDIPPQYGPGYDGGFEGEWLGWKLKVKTYVQMTPTLQYSFYVFIRTRIFCKIYHWRGKQKI
jgi:glutathione S-transferase